NDKDTPQALTSLSNVAQVAAGNTQSCALLQSGTATCWGLNAQGQVGDGSTTNRTSPTPVSGLSGAVAIDAGDNHACAVLGSGALECWGANWSGAIGDGTTTHRTTPVVVTDLGTDVAAVSLGTDHSCALTSVGEALCWGSNTSAQLGDATMTDRLVPTAV